MIRRVSVSAIQDRCGSDIERRSQCERQQTYDVQKRFVHSEHVMRPVSSIALQRLSEQRFCCSSFSCALAEPAHSEVMCFSTWWCGAARAPAGESHTSDTTRSTDQGLYVRHCWRHQSAVQGSLRSIWGKGSAGTVGYEWFWVSDRSSVTRRDAA